MKSSHSAVGHFLRVARSLPGLCDLSQERISQMLGYTFNIMHKWQSGRTQMPWRDFVRFCRLADLDIDSVMAAVLLYPYQPEDGDKLARHLGRGRKSEELSSVTGLSAGRLNRIFKGSQEPTSKDMFALIGSGAAQLHPFVSALLGPAYAASSAAISNDAFQNSAEVHIICNEPAYDGILYCLTLDEYQAAAGHPVGFIARTMRITSDDEERALAWLLKSGLVKREPSGKYRPYRSKRCTSGADRDSFRKIVSYWFGRIQSRLAGPLEDAVGIACGYEVFACGRDTRDQIMSLSYEYMSKMRELIMADKGPKTSVYTSVNALFDNAGKPFS